MEGGFSANTTLHARVFSFNPVRQNQSNRELRTCRSRFHENEIGETCGVVTLVQPTRVRAHVGP